MLYLFTGIRTDSLFSFLDYSGEDGIVFIFMAPSSTSGMFGIWWVLEMCVKY